MEENDKKIQRRQFTEDFDFDLNLAIPRKNFNFLTSKNDNIFNRINAQWNDDFFQGLLKESFENIQKNILDFEEAYGENKVLTAMKENLSNPETFSAYVNQAITAGIFIEILNDLIADEGSFYDERICQIFEDKKFLQNCIKENEDYLIKDVYTAATQYGSENNSEIVFEDAKSDSLN